jgi:hypothetical protein
MSALVIRDGDEDRHGPLHVDLLAIQTPDAAIGPRILVFNLTVLLVRMKEGNCTF